MTFLKSLLITKFKWMCMSYFWQISYELNRQYNVKDLIYPAGFVNVTHFINISSWLWICCRPTPYLILLLLWTLIDPGMLSLVWRHCCLPVQERLGGVADEDGVYGKFRWELQEVARLTHGKHPNSQNQNSHSHSLSADKISILQKTTGVCSYICGVFRMWCPLTDGCMWPRLHSVRLFWLADFLQVW